MRDIIFAFVFLVWLMAVTVVCGYSYFRQQGFEGAVGKYAAKTDDSLKQIVGYINQQIQQSQKPSVDGKAA